MAQEAICDADHGLLTVDAPHDTFAYDQANRLRTATVAGVTETSVYDGDGVRFSRQVGAGPITRYVTDPTAGLPVTIDDGTRTYVWGASGLAYAVSGTAIEVQHADRLGSIRAVTDGTGAVVATFRTDEFGIPTSSSGAAGSPFRFTGEPTDASGLTYLRARSYDPSLGRFLSRDPFAGFASAPLSLNRYSYVENNPATWSDPSGYFPWFIVTAAVGAVVSTGVYLAITPSENWTPEGTLGAAAGGAVAGAIAGVAGPLAGTAVAQAGIGGVGGAVVQASLAAGLNFGAGALGTLANSYVSTGGPPSAKDYLLGGLTGVVSGGLANVLTPLRGVSYMSQVPRFTPRTASGLSNLGAANTRALYGSAMIGGALEWSIGYFSKSNVLR